MLQEHDPKQKSPVLVELSDVVLKIDQKTILGGVSMRVHQNEVVAVLGPSGSGKSTLIRIIAGLLAPTHGEVNIYGQRIGLAFQQGALFTSYNVAGNVALPLEKSLHLPPEEVERRIDEALKTVGLENDAYKMPNELSGGMQKRVGVARALATYPDIMLYDEPSAGLDPILAHKLDQDLRVINQQRQMATIVVTHELSSVEILADRVILLYGGRFVFNGTKALFFETQEPHVRQFLTRSLVGPMAQYG